MKKLFKDLKKQFKQDLKKTPEAVYLEGFGTISSLIACTTLATFTNEANMLFVFTMYLLGSLGLFAGAKIRNNSFLILLNFGYTAVNLLAIANILL